MIERRSVIEVPFNLPQGAKNHPAIVISSNYANEHDNTIIAVMITHNQREDDFTFRLADQMFTGNRLPSSYQARVHLISLFSSERDIIRNSYLNIKMKEDHFNRMMERIIHITLGYKIPFR